MQLTVRRSDSMKCAFRKGGSAGPEDTGEKQRKTDGTIPRWGQVAKNLEREAKKFGISPTGNEGSRNPPEGVWARLRKTAQAVG